MKIYPAINGDKLLIIGSDGLAKQCLQTLLQPEYQHMHITFFDDVNKDPNDFGYSIETQWKNIENNMGWYTHYMICLGDPDHKKEFAKKLSALTPLDLISDGANRHHAKVGSGCIILDNVLIEPHSVIGNHVLLNHGAKVFHDVIIGDYCEISPGATILGKARIGNGCRIGANATILPGVILYDNCTVGAGAVVTRNVAERETVVGVPAKEHS